MQALEKLIRSNEVTLVWVSGHHAIPANEEAYKLAKEWTNGVPSDQYVSIPSVVGTEVIRYPLKQEPLKKSKSCKGCRQSKTLMNEPLPGKELQAMNRQRLKAAMGLLIGRTTLKDVHSSGIADCAGTKKR
jgi:hypothetical protein